MSYKGEWNPRDRPWRCHVDPDADRGEVYQHEHSPHCKHSSSMGISWHEIKLAGKGNVIDMRCIRLHLKLLQMLQSKKLK